MAEVCEVGEMQLKSVRWRARAGPSGRVKSTRLCNFFPPVSCIGYVTYTYISVHISIRGS